MSFNPNAFMDEAPGGKLDTALEPPREGEYMFTPESCEISEQTSTKPEHAGKSWPRMTIQWRLMDEAEKQRLGRDNVFVRQQFLLDTDPTTGRLDFGKGKNVRLGSIYEALGMNDGTGTPNRINNASGTLVLGRVTHTSAKNDPETKYAEVSRVAKVV